MNPNNSVIDERSIKMHPGNCRFFLISIAFVSCVSPSTKKVESNIRSLDHWGNWKSIPLEERINLASDAMVDFIQQDNLKNDIPNRPFRPSYDKALWNEIRQAVSSMPDNVKKLASEKLAAIILIGDLGSTGFSDIIRDERGKASAGFVIMDVKAINRKANDWATWKENTPFAHDNRITLKVFIEDPKHDNRIQAIQYILLHEIGHVLAIGENFHPSWDERMKSADALKFYPFASVSWKLNPQNFDYDLLATHDGFGCYPVHYYSAKPSLSLAEAESCYRALERTAFVSLYAGTNPFDDFAETFVFYVHRVLLNKPWYLEIQSPSGIYRYEPSWSDERLEQKRSIIESLLSR